MCDERERMLEYLYEECSPAERRRAEAHLAGCEVCQDELQTLRTVRNELAAWDVPVRPSVWTPFAPPRAAAWWRQVPTWAMAAAAALVFAVGGLGGFALRAASPQPQMAAASGAAPANAADLEQRVLDRVRADLTSGAIARPQTTAPVPVPVSDRLSDQELMRQMRQLIAASDQRQQQQWASFMNGLLAERDAQYRSSLEGVRKQVDGLDYTVSQLINFNRQAGARSAKDKE
jgi:anti-sigma factor RsiW